MTLTLTSDAPWSTIGVQASSFHHQGQHAENDFQPTAAPEGEGGSAGGRRGAPETLGVPIPTLRYYERLGVVPHLGTQRERNNYRDYTPEQLEALRTVLALKASGLPLHDIARS